LGLLALRVTHAGALWRDECSAVQLATMPTLDDLLQNFHHETFPPFSPIILRAYAAVFGTSDISFRALGFVIGMLVLAALWLNARLLTKTAPLMSLALLGLNSTFLIWGTSIRGYGLATFAVLLLFGLAGKMLLEPNGLRIAAVLIASVAAVQLLLYNFVFLTAIALATATVCMTRRQRRLAIAMIAILCASAVSILPYAGPFFAENQSTIIFRGPVEFGWFWQQLRLALGDPVEVMTVWWVALFVVLISAAAARLYLIRSRKPLPEYDLLLYGALVAVASIIFYFVFLKVLSYRTREWYYLVVLAVLAVAIDLLAANLARIKWVRVARLVVVIAAVLGMPFAVWGKVIQRHTNMDAVARKLEEVAQPRDLIVVNPWYLGVSFNWYYHGATTWVTCPTMPYHRGHRFDLVKAKMMSFTPIDDLREMIGATLQSNNRVWFVGGVIILPPDRMAIVLPPAPNTEFGWSGDAYSESWSQQLGDLLRRRATSGEFVPISTPGPINELEDVPLFVAQGWRE
jgi:MFS family permease